MTDVDDGDGVDAQAEYDGDDALRELLTRAAQSPTVHRDNDGNDGNDDNDADDGAAWVDRLRSGSRLRDVIADDDSNDDNNADDDRPVGGMS